MVEMAYWTKVALPASERVFAFYADNRLSILSET